MKNSIYILKWIIPVDSIISKKKNWFANVVLCYCETLDPILLYRLKKIFNLKKYWSLQCNSKNNCIINMKQWYIEKEKKFIIINYWFKINGNMYYNKFQKAACWFSYKGCLVSLLCSKFYNCNAFREQNVYSDVLEEFSKIDLLHCYFNTLCKFIKHLRALSVVDIIMNGSIKETFQVHTAQWIYWKMYLCMNFEFIKEIKNGCSVLPFLFS